MFHQKSSISSHYGDFPSMKLKVQMYSFAHIFIYTNYHIFMTKISLNFHKKMQVCSTRFNSEARLVKGMVLNKYFKQVSFIYFVCMCDACRGQCTASESWLSHTMFIQNPGHQAWCSDAAYPRSPFSLALRRFQLSFPS